VVVTSNLYDPAKRWNDQWRNVDLIVWDIVAVQPARQSVRTEGPPRTLRKATPIPQLSFDQVPSYSSAE
jgi:hypothetical protein